MQRVVVISFEFLNPEGRTDTLSQNFFFFFFFFFFFLRRYNFREVLAFSTVSSI
jgi:hypothetical protein